MAPPQAGQVQAPSCFGSCTTSCRGRWSGSFLRLGWLFWRIGSGWSSRAAWLIASASPASNSSSRNSSCSICRVTRSEERPNCIRRSLAIWNFSFSISRVRSWTASLAACSSAVASANSLWQARAKARNASGSEGRSAEASDIRHPYRTQPHRTRTNRESLSCYNSIGRGGGGGAMVRRQSIASISSRRCQHHCVVDQRRPNEFAPLQTLGEQTHATAVPVQALQIMTPFAAEEKNMTAERISPDDLLHLGRQTIEAGAQIDRLTGEKNLRFRR